MLYRSLLFLYGHGCIKSVQQFARSVVKFARAPRSLGPFPVGLNISPACGTGDFIALSRRLVRLHWKVSSSLFVACTLLESPRRPPRPQPLSLLRFAAPTTTATMPASSRRRDDDTISEASSISSRRSQPGLPRIDTGLPQSGRPRPKFVSFGQNSDVTPNREFINESSPLINPADAPRETDRLLKEPIPPALSGPEDGDYFPEFEETKSSFFLFLLTLGGLGLQIGWSVETSNGSVSRSSTKSMTTLIMMCSPICCPSGSASRCLHWSGSPAPSLVCLCSPTLD